MDIRSITNDALWAFTQIGYLKPQRSKNGKLYYLMLKDGKKWPKRKEEIEMKNKLMWYVCYGSNLCFDRFKCYITGEGCSKYNIEPKDDRTCEDQTLPSKTRAVIIPYELYFDHCSKGWKGSSVAFIDPYKEGKTVGRAYLVTEQQFEHIMKHECSNGKHKPDPHDLYGHVVDLGIIDGYPAKTFTRFERKGARHKVRKEYRKCMMDGLKEVGLSEEDAKAYLAINLKH